MNSSSSLPGSRERGSALIVGMIIMIVMAISGLSMMNTTLLGERKSSNARAQLQAFLAAEAGTSKAQDYLILNWASYSCTVNGALPGMSGVAYGSASYTVTAVACGPDEITLKSSGIQQETGASRDIQFVLQSESLRGGGLGGAINFVGNVVTFDTPNSNAFKVDGIGGPAITAATDGYRDGILAAIPSDRIDNYIGGVVTADFPETWSTASGLQTLVGAIATSPDARIYNVGGDVDANDLGSSSNMKITVVKGDLSLKGNDTGAGLMVVYGDLSYQGTPSWDGLIIVLGGTFAVGGGGNGGVEGSMFIADVDTSLATWAFTGSNLAFDTNGGGTADYTYDCDKLSDARDLMNATGKGLWDMDAGDCSSPGSGTGSGGVVMTQWRELIAR
uniref:pilus assembly PilX family protein n=1 Tax=Marinobacterium profundum TaxID=1714300 RepID=UPI0008376F62|nr:PilX N-terminal domain-containing pilus assembly protein [Marinobacterium profundum]